MSVFDKTESLVMMPLCSAFNVVDKTDALAAGNIVKMTLHQCVGTNVALCCCRMNMAPAGRAKFADCNAHEDKKVISKQLSKMCVPKLHRTTQGKGNLIFIYPSESGRVKISGTMMNLPTTTK